MSLLSRADLLRVLAVRDERGVRAEELASALGFEGVDEAVVEPSLGDRGADDGKDDIDAPVPSAVPRPSRPAKYWYVAAHEVLPGDERPREAANTAGEPEDDADALPSLGVRPVSQPPLRVAGQWQNLWDRALPTRRRGRAIDVRRSTRLLAQARPVRQLPRQQRRAFNRDVVLILDRGRELYPAWEDMRRAWKTLDGLMGRGALHAFHLPSGPAGQWHHFGARGVGGLQQLPDGALVVAIGVFGGLHDGQISESWAGMFHELGVRGHLLTLLPLCPLSGHRLPSWALDPGGYADAELPVQRLLMALSQAWMADPAQLRRLRHAVPHADLHTELRVWNHDHVEREERRMNLGESEVLAYLAEFSADGGEWRQAVADTIQDWQGNLGATAREAERLQQALLGQLCARDFPHLRRQARAARAQLDRGAPVSLAHGHLRALLPILRLLASRNPESGWDELLDVAQRIALREGQALPRGHIGLRPGRQRRWLYQRGDGLALGEPGDRMVMPLLSLGEQPYCEQTRRVFTGNERLIGDTLTLIDRQVRYRLAVQYKPVWAQRIWIDRDGLHAAHEAGAEFRLEPAGPERPEAGWVCTHQPWTWADGVGVDKVGLWADIELRQTVFGNNPLQRLRWIPPGEFVMGSPEAEPGRVGNETQHPVRLTQGYWLGETSVTQAFWREVMGENPSHHQGDRLPVEQVNWEDCQVFLDKLRKRLPGLGWTLPSEAQWEYACRAGTTTAYWWGDEMDEKYANNGGETRDERDYPGNPFGLCSMSGNVWEWCADWSGEYPAEPVVDPAGPEQGHERVLRGGSWLDDGRNLRSAYRNALAPDSRSRYIGLRLAGGFDPQASQAGAGTVTADRRARSDRQRGGQGAGDGRGTNPGTEPR